MFGPLQIRVGRKTLKEAHAIIFTCMTTRAVHLELVTDRSTDAFLMAFRRFASLIGNPNNCWSDCGTNFIGAQNYLKETMQEWDIPKIHSAFCEEFSCTVSLELGCSTSQPSKWCSRKSYQICTKSTGSFV